MLGIEPANAAHKLARLLLTENRLAECVAFVEGERAGGRATPALLTILGDARLGLGEIDRAEESYRLALAGGGQTDAAAHLGLAQVFVRRGDAQGAAPHLARARAAAGDSPDLLYGFALVALRAGFVEESHAALVRAEALRPGDPRVLFLTGVAWLKAARPDLNEAEQAFRRFNELRPDHAQGQLFLGYVLLKQKRRGEARAGGERQAEPRRREDALQSGAPLRAAQRAAAGAGTPAHRRGAASQIGQPIRGRRPLGTSNPATVTEARAGAGGCG